MPAGRGAMNIAGLTRLSSRKRGDLAALGGYAGARLLSAAHARHAYRAPVRRWLLSPQSCFACMPSPDSPRFLTSRLCALRVQAWRMNSGKDLWHSDGATPMTRCAVRPEESSVVAHTMIHVHVGRHNLPFV